VVAEPVQGFRAVDVAHEAIVDADSLGLDLCVRGPLPGDRFFGLGAPGSRKLKEVLIELRVPARDRTRSPLVVCGERIVWVCGLAVAEEVKVTRETKRFMRLSVARDRNGASTCAPS
jgi:tRNA(Ile)-lysidine synthase